MAKAGQGNKVKVHYKGTLTDGSVFDSSEGREPLEFTLGEGQVIPGFDAGVCGMEVGEKKTIEIPADQAYGPHFAEGIMVVDRSEFPEDMYPEVGDQLQMRQPDGSGMIVRVTCADEKSVTLDANHPLAGQDLIFEVELVDIASSIITI
ncbi:MAG: FKBP-type peptidyl-prolyl cis-trans isomerase [Armatimonadota bacterium]